LKPFKQPTTITQSVTTPFINPHDHNKTTFVSNYDCGSLGEQVTTPTGCIGKIVHISDNDMLGHKTYTVVFNDNCQ